MATGCIYRRHFHIIISGSITAYRNKNTCKGNLKKIIPRDMPQMAIVTETQ